MEILQEVSSGLFVIVAIAAVAIFVSVAIRIFKKK